MRGLDLPGHVGQLLADDRLIDQPLSKGLSLLGVLDGLLWADVRERQEVKGGKRVRQETGVRRKK
jgi:hypothetical protein